MPFNDWTDDLTSWDETRIIPCNNNNLIFSLFFFLHKILFFLIFRVFSRFSWISLVKIRLFWVVESSKYSFWRFWCLFCDWTGAEIGKCLGRGYSSCRQKKREMNERKSSSAHADLDSLSLNTPLLTLLKRVDGGSLIHESTDSSLNIMNIVIYDFVYLR